MDRYLIYLMLRLGHRMYQNVPSILWSYPMKYILSLLKRNIFLDVEISLEVNKLNKVTKIPLHCSMQKKY